MFALKNKTHYYTSGLTAACLRISPQAESPLHPEEDVSPDFWMRNQFYKKVNMHKLLAIKRKELGGVLCLCLWEAGIDRDSTKSGQERDGENSDTEGKKQQSIYIKIGQSVAHM